MRITGREERYFTGSRLMPMVSLIVFFLLCSSVPAFAHKVYIYAWVEGNTIYTESYFSGGGRVKNGVIQVFDARGKDLLEGRTNAKGEFSFQIPEKATLRIVVNASMGHRGEYVLKAEEIGENPPAESKRKDAAKVSNRESHSVIRVEEDQIRRIVEASLDSRLRPIARSIARLQEDRGPGFTEIVGGIGYIFGIMGLALYFRGRRGR